MARYIDADALIRVLDVKADMAMGTPKEVFLSVAKMVDCLPPADVAPRAEVVREIFGEIEKLHLHITNEFDLRRYEDLKKKYTEGQK